MEDNPFTQKLKGPALNTVPGLKLAEFKGTCQRQANKYGKPCGAALGLHTWSNQAHASVRCPHCGGVQELNAV